MKRIAFRIPKSQKRAVIIVDDQDAGRFKSEYWLARMNKGYLEIYKIDSGVNQGLGRELLGITEDGTCVIHRNDDRADFRRANLMAIPREVHQRLLGLLMAGGGNNVGHLQEFCKRGHALEAENRMSNGKSGTTCRKCASMRGKRSYEIRKALTTQGAA